MKTESIKRSFTTAKSLSDEVRKKRFDLSYELILFCLLVVFVLTIGLINPAFFSWGTLFDVLRNQTLNTLLAFGLLPIVILGGFDVSFVVVSSLATFLARVIMGYLNIDGIGTFYLMSMITGAACGLLLGWIVNRFKLSIFDFSLGVTSLITGFLAMATTIGIQGGRIEAMKGWNMRWLMTVQSTVGRSGLHVSILIVIAAAIFVHVFLRYTIWGRAMYAAGSDKTVFDSGAAVREDVFTVYEGDTTIKESAATVPDGGTTLLDAALSDAATRADDASVENIAIRKGESILDTYTVESEAIEGGMVACGAFTTRAGMSIWQ